MMRRYIFLCVLCLSPTSFAGNDVLHSSAKDLFLGEAYYYASQGEYFEAITRLANTLSKYHKLGDPKTDPLHVKIQNARFTLGDFELSYRMPQRAAQVIKPVLEGIVDQSIRNETNFRLARIHLQTGSPYNALGYIEKIGGRVPADFRDDELFLRAQIYMGAGKPEDAIKILKKLQGSASYEGFASYNLGIALILNGQELEGIEQLDKTGQIQGNNEGALAIRDKANLILGNRLISAEQPAMAKQYLDRVRLTGPFSNTALLGSGMADVTLGKFDRALVPWSILQKRNVTDRAVQESMLGVPFAYSRLELYGRAALLYGSALESFGAEHARLEASIKSIREGKLLKTLLRKEFKRDKNWPAQFKALPETPETRYLMEMMAAGDFQESLKNYFDLNELREKLDPWQGDLDAFEELIQKRKQYYESILPNIDKQRIAIDNQMRLLQEQKQVLDERLSSMAKDPQPEFLESADDRMARENMRLLADRYKNDSSPSANEIRQRIKQEEDTRLHKLSASYDKRLNEAKARANLLEDELDKLRNNYSSFEISRHAATQSYKGYINQISQLNKRIQSSREKVIALLEKQGHMLEVMAINELEQRRKKLQEYQMLARFSLSESYDRASKKQLEEGAKK